MSPIFGPSQPNASPETVEMIFLSVEREIMSGQLPQERVPEFLAKHPAFAAWYQSRQTGKPAINPIAHEQTK